MWSYTSWVWLKPEQLSLCRGTMLLLHALLHEMELSHTQKLLFWDSGLVLIIKQLFVTQGLVHLIAVLQMCGTTAHVEQLTTTPAGCSFEPHQGGNVLQPRSSRTDNTPMNWKQYVVISFSDVSSYVVSGFQCIYILNDIYMYQTLTWINVSSI